VGRDVVSVAKRFKTILKTPCSTVLDMDYFSQSGLVTLIHLLATIIVTQSAQVTLELTVGWSVCPGVKAFVGLMTIF